MPTVRTTLPPPRHDPPPRRLDDPAPLVVDLLRAVLLELQGLRADLTRPRRPSLRRADRDRLTPLLPVIAATFGSDPFAVNELLEHESPAIRLVTRGLSAAHVGRLLRRALGHPIDGLIVQRVGSELHRNLWRIEEVITS